MSFDINAISGASETSLVHSDEERKLDPVESKAKEVAEEVLANILESSSREISQSVVTVQGAQEPTLLSSPVVPDRGRLSPLFPVDQGSLRELAEKAKAEAGTSLKKIYDIWALDRNFENTVKAFDVAIASFRIRNAVIEIISMVHPEKEMRDLASDLNQDLSEFSVDAFEGNKQFYHAYQEYMCDFGNDVEHSEQEQYYLKDLAGDFRRAGFSLPEAEFEKASSLKKELSALSIEFGKNINEDDHSIKVRREGLEGLGEDFISGLKTEGEEFVLTVDYPTYFKVQEECFVEATRRDLFVAFSQRAHPANEGLLKQIIEKRSQLASTLGYTNYSTLDLESEMVGTPQKAQQFIDSLVPRLQEKAALECLNLLSDLPPSVELSDGKIKPWDIRFLKSQYSKTHLNVDENEIEKYFPMDETIQGLLDVYERFFGIQLKSVEASGFWHDSVKMMEVSKDGKLLGHIALDLFPRDGKYSHACCCEIVPPYSREDGSVDPAFTMLICNFPEGQADKPALMRFDDVETFFHEFGHAIHFVMGRAEMPTLAGFFTKTDFVEMPSQILEEWLSEPEILEMVTHHHETGETLPRDLMESKIRAKNAFSGFDNLRQLTFASLALNLFEKESVEDVQKEQREIRESLNPHLLFDDRDHFTSSFGHLTDYGAKYYGYMWSKVFALDVFNKIKERNGLLDSSVGDDYVRHIIGRGGSCDPNDMIRNFLGREPNQDAFLESLGV